MSILLERTKQTQAATYQGEPVKAEKAGRVQWAAIDGARVQAWDTLAEIAGNYGTSVIGCNASGILAHVAKNGEPVLAGQIVAYVKPVERAQTRQSVQPAPTVAPIAKTPQRQPGEAQRVADEQPANIPPTLAESQPAPRPIAPPAPARRSTMAPALELTILEPEDEPAPQPVKRPRRPKIVRKTCRPTDHQEQALASLMDDLSKAGFDYSEGELHRIMFDWLLGLSRRDLVAIAEVNRDKEQQGRFGYGARPTL